jgi:hypothetical protein
LVEGGEDPDQPAGDPAQGEDRPRDDDGQPLGVAQRDGLRRQLAEDQRQIGDRDDDQPQRGRLGRAPEPGADQQRREGLHRGGTADGRGQRADQRDPHLDGGQERLGALLQAQRGGGGRRAGAERNQAADPG